MLTLYSIDTLFDQKTCIHFLNKVVLLLIMSSVPAYSEPVLEPPHEVENSAFSQFLAKNLHLTVLDFDKAVGTPDLFVIGEKHHAWYHVGGFGQAMLGVGGGYRYLVKGDYPYRDWLLGLYGYARWKDKPSHHRIKLNGGIEGVTAHWQWTVNGYYTYPLSEKENFDYEEGRGGVSLRVSTYYLQKMKMLGRINPFFFGAYTQVEGKKANQRLEPTRLWNGGAGVRWELPYLAFEGKVIWDQGEKICTPWEFGLQIDFAGRRDKTVSYATHRVREMPQCYEPSYGYKATNKEKDEGKHHAASERDERKSDIADSDSVSTS